VYSVNFAIGKQTVAPQLVNNLLILQNSILWRSLNIEKGESFKEWADNVLADLNIDEAVLAKQEEMLKPTPKEEEQKDIQFPFPMIPEAELDELASAFNY